jgi:hypothetical protein
LNVIHASGCPPAGLLLFNPEFLREKGLPVAAWLERYSDPKIPFEKV